MTLLYFLVCIASTMLIGQSPYVCLHVHPVWREVEPLMFDIILVYILTLEPLIPYTYSEPLDQDNDVTEEVDVT